MRRLAGAKIHRRCWQEGQKANEASLFHLHGPVHMGFPTRFHRRLRLVSYTGSIAGTMRHDIRLTRFLENVDASQHTWRFRPHESPEGVRNFSRQISARVFCFTLNPAVGVGRAADFCDFSTKSCCVSQARGVAASATDGPEGKLGRLSRGFAASVAGSSTAPHFLPARAKKWRQRETPSRPESPSRVNSLR